MGARSASTRGERRGDGPSSWRPRTDRTYHEVGIRYNAQDNMPLIEEENLAMEQGNYSLRRPPKLIIPQAVIKQSWASVCRFIPELSPSASVTGGQVQIWWAGFAWH